MAVAATMFGACSEDDIAGIDTSTQQITTDSAGTWVFLQLGDPAEKVAVASPTTSAAWHMGFRTTSVMLNGGAAGPGGVKGYCVCQNAGATNDQIASMTATSELPDFEAVTVEDIPAADAWITDDLVPAIFGWYSGTAGASATANAAQTFLISEGTGTARIVGKFHVTAIESPTATFPGTITLEYALQTAPGGDFGATMTVTVETGAEPVYVKLTEGTLGTSGDWDLQIDGWMIRLNSGASGTGTWKALSAEGTPFSTISATFASGPPESTFKTDVFGGVFAETPWYRYNITGTDNQIWPTFNVYLVAAGGAVYKVQLISYYNIGGSGRFITVRYARIQ